MLVPVTGRPGGNRNSTVVSEMYASETMSAVHPSQPGSRHLRSGSVLRPRRQLTAMGMAYERSSATTDPAMMALKALRVLACASDAVAALAFCSPSRAQENEPKDDDDARRQNEGVERQAEPRVDFGEEARGREAAVSASVSAASLSRGVERTSQRQRSCGCSSS